MQLETQSLTRLKDKEVSEFFLLYSPQVYKISQELYKMICTIMMPGKNIYLDKSDRTVSFGSEKTMKGTICFIKPLKDSVNLGFFYGTNIPDPDNLMTGSGKLLRHIKVKSMAEVENPAIRFLIENALREHDERLN